MSIRKKGAVYSVVALMLCVAVYLNWSYNRDAEGYSSAPELESGKMLGEAQLVDGNTGDDTSSAVSGDYFSEARLSRQKARDEAVGILNKTIENQQTDEVAGSVGRTGDGGNGTVGRKGIADRKPDNRQGI